MKNKNGIIWSFIFFLTVAGCATHQKPAGNNPVAKPGPTYAPASVSSGHEAGGASENPSGLEDETGYRIKRVEIEIERGMPYLPVGAEFITKDGKVALGDVIKALADHKGFSVSWAVDVDQQKPVDCYIKAADNFYDAIDNILRQLDYFHEIHEDTIVVKYKETKKYHIAMPNFSEEMDTSLGGNMLPDVGDDDSETGLEAKASLKIESEPFNFWDDLNESLANIIKCDGCPAPIIDRTLGTITISASRSTHNEIERHLATLEEKAYRQVIIEAKIIEVALTEAHEKGIDWEGVFSGKILSGTIELGDDTGYIYKHGDGWNRFLSGITINDVPWDTVVSAFETYGDTRILANPKVHILNGRSAVLSAGQVISYLEGCNVTSSEFGFVDAEAEINSVTEGLSVGIKANILDDDEVVLYVFPAITRINEFRLIGESSCGDIEAPDMSVREMATHAKVNDGEILVIGGLIQETKETNTKKVPVLGDLPYLGKYVFSYEKVDNVTRELVILLKPRIVNAQVKTVSRK